MTIVVIGIDLGKSSCSVAGMDAVGSVVFRRWVKRAGLTEIVRRHPGCPQRPWCVIPERGRAGPRR